MKKLKQKVTILPHTPKEFIIPWNGKFDMERALLYGGVMAGECYAEDGFDKLSQEKPSSSHKRGVTTALQEHYTTHEHIHVGLEISNFSKFLAMTLNNERQAVTSEKSARYTEINPLIDENISELESIKYTKWIEEFKKEIKRIYPNKFSDSELQKKSQENARYMVTSFSATKLNHTLPLVQLNRVASFMMDFCNEVSKKSFFSKFELNLAKEYTEFIYHLDDLGLLDSRLQSNKKNRKLSIFADREVENYFSDAYSTHYKGSIAQYAQAHRHRTNSHSMIFDTNSNNFYVPEIIKENDKLKTKWLKDINDVADAYPQGKLVTINEIGTIDSLIMKSQERRCASAQLEIDIQTLKTLKLAYASLLEKNHPDAEKVQRLVLGPRCSAGYKCDNNRCKFPGKQNDSRLI